MISSMTQLQTTTNWLVPLRSWNRLHRKACSLAECANLCDNSFALAQPQPLIVAYDPLSSHYPDIKMHLIVN